MEEDERVSERRGGGCVEEEGDMMIVCTRMSGNGVFSRWKGDVDV